MSNNIKLERKKLYKEVWTEPMSRLAPKYGLSDNGLKKICKKLSVPVPPENGNRFILLHLTPQPVNKITEFFVEHKVCCVVQGRVRLGDDCQFSSVLFCKNRKRSSRLDQKG
jgi:hypothetical protein